jgi:hypothetical protein
MDEMKICGCIGPQNGEPKCPCAMRGVFQRDGRWIQAEVDLGPVSPGRDSRQQIPSRFPGFDESLQQYWKKGAKASG